VTRAIAFFLPELAQQLREVADSVFAGNDGTNTTQGNILIVETLTDGLLEDVLDVFEPAVKAVEGTVTVRRQQRAFTAVVMRALNVQKVLGDSDAERAGQRLLKRAGQVRESVAKACSKGEPETMDQLRCAPYPASGAPPLPWEESTQLAVVPVPAPAPAPAPAPVPEPELPQPIVERPSRIKFFLHEKRSWDDDGCARVAGIFDGDHDDLQQDGFTDTQGHLTASGLRFVVSSLLIDLRAAERERDNAERETQREAAARQRESAFAESLKVSLKEEQDALDAAREEHRVALSSAREETRTAEERAYARVPQMLDEYYGETLERTVKERTEELEKELEEIETALEQAEERLNCRATGACPWCGGS
jgi:hypothetical protein